MNLRPYQERAVSAVRDAYLQGCRSVLLVGPTGFGKTAVSSHLIARAVERGRECLFLVHRREIVADTAARLAKAGVQCSVVMAGVAPMPGASVHVASVQTIAAREAHPAAQFIIVDECHHVAARTYRTILEQYPAAMLLGITATPERADGRPLGDVFERLVVGATVPELQALGFLSYCDVIAPRPSVENALAMDPVDAYVAHAGSRPAIVFCANQEHARTTAASFAERGIPSACVVAETSNRARERAIAAFRAGELQVLTNVYALTEGFDAPRAKVCVLARGVGSAGPFIQMVGRVLRPDPAAPDLRALLIDLRGAVHEHGLPSETRRFTLERGIERAATVEDELAPCRSCMECGAYFEANRAVRVAGKDACPMCGAPLPRPRPPRVKARPLSQVTHVATVEEKVSALAGLLRTAARTGRREGWAAHVFKAKFNGWPTPAMMNRAKEISHAA